MVIVVSKRFGHVERDIQHSRGYGIAKGEQRGFIAVHIFIDRWVHAYSNRDRADSVVVTVQREVRYCGLQMGSSLYRSHICVASLI